MELHKKDDDTVLDKKEIIGDATVTFDNLDKYDSAGNEIQYEIREGQAIIEQRIHLTYGLRCRKEQIILQMKKIMYLLIL